MAPSSGSHKNFFLTLDQGLYLRRVIADVCFVCAAKFPSCLFPPMFITVNFHINNMLVRKGVRATRVVSHDVITLDSRVTVITVKLANTLPSPLQKHYCQIIHDDLTH